MSYTEAQIILCRRVLGVCCIYVVLVDPDGEMPLSSVILQDDMYCLPYLEDLTPNHPLNILQRPDQFPCSVYGHRRQPVSCVHLSVARVFCRIAAPNDTRIRGLMGLGLIPYKSTPA